jgi:diaminopimelate epimerase
MPWDFYKYHALGNDYIVIDPNETEFDLSSDNIRLICDRNFGIGSDGILYGPVFENGKMGLRIFNPDGSEAEKSGNGIRIFSKYIVDAGYTRDDKFELYTAGGKVGVQILNETASLIKVDMGTPSFTSSLIPVSGAEREVVNETLKINDSVLKVTCLTIGNPHCVIPLDVISKEAALEIGPLVENHPMFPRRVNMQLLKVIDKNNIQIEIWERGAGYTLASGSSSCAAASAAYKLGLVDNHVTVHMPGGMIDIEIKKDGHIYMTGAVLGVAKGEFLEEIRELLSPIES